VNYKGHEVIENPQASESKSGIVAQFPGVCVRCKGAIVVGQLIGKNPTGGWFHVVCDVPGPSVTARIVDPMRVPDPEKLVGRAATLTAEGFVVPGGLPNGVWTIEGPRGHRTFRISTILEQDVHHEDGLKDSFRAKHAGKRVLELLTGPDNTASYRGLAWYDGKIGKLWKLGVTNEVLVNTFAKLVERGEQVPGYTVHFARHCYKCNRLLTTPESIKRGIGPICASGGWD
jgi:hypothetical protein